MLTAVKKSRLSRSIQYEVKHMAAAVGEARSTSMLRSCNGKLWQLLDSENDKLTLRYAKFVIKRRGGTGRFVSKPPVSLEWPRTGKLPFKENCITIDNTDFLAGGKTNVELMKLLAR